MTDAELEYTLSAIADIARKGAEWGEEYRFDRTSGEFRRLDGRSFPPVDPGALFGREGLV